ncbi:MAG: 50S ribosomal protein L10, partial [Microbacterium sp.]
MAQKDATVAELTKNFEDSTAVLLTEYRGLTVAQLKELRNSIRQDAEYAVV